MTLLKKFGWCRYSRIRIGAVQERTDVFIGCCVDHAGGHGERSLFPLMLQYLRVISVSMNVKSPCARKISDFLYTKDIALQQLQNCSTAVTPRRSTENCAGSPKVHGAETGEAGRYLCPFVGFDGWLFWLLVGRLNGGSSARNLVGRFAATHRSAVRSERDPDAACPNH
jgi:hypothetical protein